VIGTRIKREEKLVLLIEKGTITKDEYV